MVVRATAGNLLRSVQLLGEDQPHELVRKHELRKAPHEIGPLAHPIINSVSPANDDRDLFRRIERTLQPRGERRRIDVLAALIEQHDEGIAIQLRKNSI